MDYFAAVVTVSVVDYIPAALTVSKVDYIPAVVTVSNVGYIAAVVTVSNEGLYCSCCNSVRCNVYYSTVSICSMFLTVYHTVFNSGSYCF